MSDDTTLTAYQIPVSTILRWPAPNTTNPQRRIWVAPFSVILVFITTLVLAARLYARAARLAGNLGLDDALIVVAWLFSVLFTAFGVYGVLQAGYDRHIWDAQGPLAVKSAFVGWFIETIFLLATCPTKISILLFYRRLVHQTYSRYMQLAIYAAIGFTMVYLLVSLLLLGLVCSPTSASWMSFDLTSTQPYKCQNRRIIDPLIGALSVFSDLYAVLMPQVIIGSLTVSRRQKLELYGIFCCGFLVIGAGLARTVLLARLHTDALRDLTWIGFEIILWTDLEMQLSIICASAPALKAFISHQLRRHDTGYQTSQMKLRTIETDDIFQTKPSLILLERDRSKPSISGGPVAEGRGKGGYADKYTTRSGRPAELEKGNLNIWVTESFSVCHHQPSLYNKPLPKIQIAPSLSKSAHSRLAM